MIKLYYIRHGESEMNKAAKLAGSTDTPLTDKGRQQAKLVGQQAKALNIDVIFASPMSRTRETAEIIAAQIGYPVGKIKFDDRLVERRFGDAEGAPWVYGIDLTGTPGLESIEDLNARISSFLDYVKAQPETTILIVAHGAVYRMFRELTQPDKKFTNITVKSKNAEIIELI